MASSVLQQLKSSHPELDVILMTGMSEPDTHMVRAIREKAFYFIEKPFNRDVMRTLVERCLELRRLREERRRNRARIDRELAEARAIQLTMLPAESADVEGVAHTARVASPAQSLPETCSITRPPGPAARRSWSPTSPATACRRRC